MHGNKRLVIIGSLLLVVAWAIWCAFFLAKGLDFTDEGLYCSEAWRFAQGDLPFRDSLAAWGLPFWWLSLVFRVYPECSLLGLRIVWAVVMLLCALVTANLMLRYFNPVLSFAGALVSLFLASGVIKVLSYNTMPILGLLLTAWLWLTACGRSGRPQVLLAGGAGLVAFLATTCRVSLVPIVFLPVLTMVYDRCCGVQMNSWSRATIAFLTTYLAGLACFFIIVGSMGLTSDFGQTFVMHTGSQGHSLQDMIYNLRDSCVYYLLPILPILLAVFLKRFRDIVAFSKKHKKTVLYIIVPIVIVCIFIVLWDWMALYKVLSWLKNDIQRLFLGSFASGRTRQLLLALAIGVVLTDVIFHIFGSNNERSASRTHQIYRLSIIAIFLSFLMILGSDNVPARSINYVSWLPVSMAIGLLWLWIPKRAEYPLKTSVVWLLRAVFIALLLLCICQGILPNRSPYRERPINELVIMPQTTKLHGILTTSARAHIVDRLVDVVRLNSKAGDRILAYENLPMLYYLTDRLPATNATWLTEGFSKPLREFLLEDMISRSRLPQLVIRATYTTRNPSWPITQRPLNWEESEQETDPIDKYIREHYKVIQEVDGFQIMVPVEPATGDR